MGDDLKAVANRFFCAVLDHKWDWFTCSRCGAKMGAQAIRVDQRFARAGGDIVGGNLFVERPA